MTATHHEEPICDICERPIRLLGMRHVDGTETARWLHAEVDTSGEGYEHEAIER